MSAHLDLDDVAAQSPIALRELQELRAENERLRALLRDCDAIAREHGGCDLWDAIDNDGVLYQSQALADALK